MSRVEHLAEGVTLYLGDCRDVLPLLPRMGAVVTDPPYGISYKSPSGRGRTLRGDYPVIAGDTEQFDPSPWLEWEQVVLFGGNHFADRLPPSAKWLVWDKRAGMAPNNNSDCELAWCKKGGSARLISHLWNGMLKASERDDLRVHPTQKPVAVMEWVLDQVACPNTPIIDPYMGSGTTGVACVRTGRGFTGIEIDPTYFEIARKRIADEIARPRMFAAAAHQPVQEALL